MQPRYIFSEQVFTKMAHINYANIEGFIWFQDDELTFIKTCSHSIILIFQMWV